MKALLGTLFSVCAPLVLLAIAACGDSRSGSADSSATAAATGRGSPYAISRTAADTAGKSSDPVSHPRDSLSARDVVRRYYDAINARDYDGAFALWADDGKANGKTRDQFAAGFAGTTRVRVTIGDSVRVEGAAGSQYATVPVVVEGVLRDGTRQRFEGAYTLRRSMVDGATAEQREWRIYSARLRAS